MTRSPAVLSALPLVLALSAQAASPRLEGKHLIETQPGRSFWATPAEMADLSARAHRAGKCGGFMDLTDAPSAASLPALPPALLGLADLDPKEQAKVTPLLGKADEGDLLAIITKLSSYDDRDYQSENGVTAAKWIKSEYERMGAGRSDIHVALEKNSFKQPSVIATIDGTGADKNEIVVIGGHIDTISYAKAPGADDDASGTATVMETFRILVESGYRPDRTIQFMGYAGEERGLLGSQEIANRYRSEGKVVAAALQYDMTMYPGSSPRITFITDYTNRDLTTFLEKLSDTYVKAKWIEDKCGYACSDHASWTKAGYPSAFPFETAFDEYNPDIHTPKDTMEKLDAGHGLSYLKLSLAFAIEMAEAQGLTSSSGGDTSSGKTGSGWPSLTRR